MRVIRVELPALLRTRDPGLSLASDEIRSALFTRLAAIEYETAEAIRHRAAGYFPPSFSMFVRLRLDPEKTRIVSEFWAVDPTVSWPQGLLTRRAWRLFVPILAHVVREQIEQRVPEVAVEINEKAAGVGAFASARTWRDPILVATGMFALTTALWVWAVPAVWPGLPKAAALHGEPAARAPATAAAASSPPPPAAAVASEESRPQAPPAASLAPAVVPQPGRLSPVPAADAPRRPPVDDRTRR